MAALDRIAFHPPWSEEAFAGELLLPHGRILVVRSAGPSGGAPAGWPIGYLAYHRVADEMHVLRIAVAPELRRRGLALALLGRGIDDARADGARVALLEVRPANRPARRLYERLGFRAVGRRPGYYSGAGEDALLLTASLEEAE